MGAVNAEGKTWRPSLPSKAREELEAFEGTNRGLPGFEKYGPRYFTREGRPMSFADWTEAMQDMEYKRVAEDTVGNW